MSFTVPCADLRGTGRGFLLCGARIKIILSQRAVARIKPAHMCRELKTVPGKQDTWQEAAFGSEDNKNQWLVYRKS